MADIEGVSRYFADRLEGDDCHDISRLLRLPGTYNFPNQKKLAKHPDRRPRQARVMLMDLDRKYQATHLPRAARAGTGSNAAVTTRVVHEPIPVPSEPVEVEELDLSTLPEAEQDKIRALIVCGPTPEHDYGGDRSKAVHYVCIGLAKAGVPRAQRLGILVNPGLRIGDHIRAQGEHRQFEYAERQIQRGEDAAASWETAGEGKILRRSQRNIKLALMKLEVELSYDQFAEQGWIQIGAGKREHLSDTIVNRLRMSIGEQFQFLPDKDLFGDVVADVAYCNSYHPVFEYLEGLKWDGVSRLENWLQTYGGADDTEFARAVGRISLIAAVRRIRKPGCKFDEMLILEGTQGGDKSTALGILAVRDDWFIDDVPLQATTQALKEQLSGVWIAEAAELRGIRTKDGEQHLKNLLSRTKDKARKSYGKFPHTSLRQCVFFGTTNERQYLRDTTGNR